MADATEYMKKFYEAIRDERMTAANTATRIGNAFLMLLQYLTSDSPFLRRDKEETTEFLFKLLAGAVIGESGQIKLNPDGSISCQRITVEGSAVFNELVFNRQNVLEGDTYFTDRGVIEKVEHTAPGQYRLTMRKAYDADVTTFHANDVIKCSINNLDAGRTYYTSWMRVDSVDTAANAIDVTLYDNEDVPGGVNYPPVAAARVIRWGNVTDKDRQSVFFVSSNEGTFLFLQGVTKPIIDDTNYSAFLGLPPDLEILKNLPINRRQPYLFARGIIYQDLIRIDYMGNPVYTARDRGFWDKDTQYIHGYDEVEQGYYTDRVWWGGCLWQAAVERPSLGKEPRYNNADWICLLGAANTRLDIWSTNGDSFLAGKEWSTTLIAEMWNAEMLIAEDELGLQNIKWERISEDSEGDKAWNLKHAPGTVGFRLDISSSIDVSGGWHAGSKVGFRCTVQWSGEPIVSEYAIQI